MQREPCLTEGASGDREIARKNIKVRLGPSTRRSAGASATWAGHGGGPGGSSSCRRSMASMKRRCEGVYRAGGEWLKHD